MADKGNLDSLKGYIGSILDNSKSEKFITPNKHREILVNVIDTLSPTYGTATNIDFYEVAMAVTQEGYSEHKLYLVNFEDTNTGATTLNVDGLGAKDMTKSDGSNLVASEIVVGKIYEVRYISDFDVFIINI